jgi:NAD(P)-dependent dehydrogenase (short-subunit alcohol dehydrogenase family)
MGITYNPFSLEKKSILVTGASSGIGRATAIECSKLGATVIVTGRNEARLQETISMMSGTGHVPLTADIDLEEDVKKLADSCPPLDGVVNNAGIGNTKPISFYNSSDLTKVFQTNTFASMILIRWLLKKKKLNNGGSLVFTSSISSRLPFPGNGIYGSSKAALEIYTKYCAQELAPKGIRANSIHPGMIETKLIHGGALSEDDLKADLSKYPLGRYGKSEEVAWLIVYLLSDASKWTTGTSVIIDGGLSIKY